jgi:protein-tyrosine phosphatase
MMASQKLTNCCVAAIALVTAAYPSTPHSSAIARLAFGAFCLAIHSFCFLGKASIMIDIHCHILPGIDDGPKELADSLEMAEIAAADGIRHIVATPHVKSEILSPAFLEEKVRQLNDKLQRVFSPLQVLRGADVSAVLPPELLARYTINKGPYCLLEFPHSHLPRNAEELVFRILVAGLRPIITHPERNPSVVRDPELLFRLIDAGGLVQITAGSLTGGFGANARECAAYLLKKGKVHFLATDAHSPTHRRPVLSPAVKEATAIIGYSAALDLVTTNPSAVIAGRPLDE